jgi:formyltetrahydrofolate deformylase
VPDGPSDPTFVLTISCPDRRGIVAAVAGFLTGHDANIIDSQQFGDPATGRFFMRVHLAHEVADPDAAVLRADFGAPGGPASTFGMDWNLHDPGAPARILVLASRLSHCLDDLLHREQSGVLPGVIVGVVSNHPDLRPLVEARDRPFHHLPMSPAERAGTEDALLALVETESVDLVVLARYMQVLSPRVCQALPGRMINIHHSFLPSFAGAKPYHQAYDRGVKLIGATAHYVTDDLDEGPIIEQEVARVDHTMGPHQLMAAGRDVERAALARAVTAHLEHRVLLNASRTVVFR